VQQLQRCGLRLGGSSRWWICGNDSGWNADAGIGAEYATAGEGRLSITLSVWWIYVKSTSVQGSKMSEYNAHFQMEEEAQ